MQCCILNFGEAIAWRELPTKSVKCPYYNRYLIGLVLFKKKNNGQLMGIDRYQKKKKKNLADTNLGISLSIWSPPVYIAFAQNKSRLTIEATKPKTKVNFCFNKRIPSRWHDFDASRTSNHWFWRFQNIKSFGPFSLMLSDIFIFL